MQKKRKARDEEGLFQVEGIRMFREIPPRDLQEIYVSQSFWEKEEGLVREMADRACIRPELVSDSVFEHLSATRTPQGILCLVRQKHYRPEDLTGEGTPFVMVLDRLQDLDVRKNYGVNVVGTKLGEDVEVNPDPAKPLESGTVMILVGHNEDLERIK